VLQGVTALHRAIAHAVIRKRARLAGVEIRFLRKYLGLSGVDFARHIGVDPSTVSTWENDKDPIGPTSDRALRLMVAVGAPVDAYSLDNLTQIGDERAPPAEVRFVPKARGWEQIDLAA
jgi:DNA-binding transcriptional regulator YiaG